MKNSTSIIASLLGGVVIGSAVTCILRKECKIDKNQIHKKIVEQLDELRNFVASHHKEELSSCSGSTCNSGKE